MWLWQLHKKLLRLSSLNLPCNIFLFCAPPSWQIVGLHQYQDLTESSITPRPTSGLQKKKPYATWKSRGNRARKTVTFLTHSYYLSAEPESATLWSQKFRAAEVKRASVLTRLDECDSQPRRVPPSLESKVGSAVGFECKAHSHVTVIHLTHTHAHTQIRWHPKIQCPLLPVGN